MYCSSSATSRAPARGSRTCPQNYKFQGKERDAETGLDDFGARYYSSNYGRWLSPDWSAMPAPVPYADLTNPQTLNLYQFVRNNPETFVDADGHGDKTANQPRVEVATCGQPDQPACSVTTGQPQTHHQPQQMSLSSQRLEFIKSYEKLKLTPYDANPPNGDMTIGHGHKILPGETFTKITEQEATELLASDVGSAVGAVNKSLKVSVSQNKFDALVSLTFNAGSVAVKPSNTIMREINSGQAVKQKDFTAYNHVKAKNGSLVVSRGLTNRRLDEYKMFSTGNYERTY